MNTNIAGFSSVTGRRLDKVRTVADAIKILNKELHFPFVMYTYGQSQYVVHAKFNMPECLTEWYTLHTPKIGYAPPDFLACLVEQIRGDIAPNIAFKCGRCGCNQHKKNYRSYECISCGQLYYWNKRDVLL